MYALGIPSYQEGIPGWKSTQAPYFFKICFHFILVLGVGVIRVDASPHAGVCD